MSGGRVTVESKFKEIKLQYTKMDFKMKLKPFESPIGIVYNAIIILANLCNCIYRNQISLFSNCNTPSLEEYISVEEH